jgi:excisionase family DNA binding protein
MPDHPAPIFLKPHELAKRWRLGRSTVYELLARGELPYYQIGGAIRIRLADVEAYENMGRNEVVMWPKVLRQKRRRIG